MDTLRYYIWKWLDSDGRFTGSGDYTELRTMFFSSSDLDLSKNMGGKGRVNFCYVYIFQETEEGVEVKVVMNFPSYCEDDTVFEGFVETERDWDRLMVILGIAKRG